MQLNFLINDVTGAKRWDTTTTSSLEWLIKLLLRMRKIPKGKMIHVKEGEMEGIEEVMVVWLEFMVGDMEK